MNILYAEDDIMMQKVVIKALIRLGYEITTVDDGVEALEAIENEKFDLIILDVFMPKASGFEVVEYMRENLKINTPVLMISRSHLDEAIQKAYTSGANDYIVKPFDPEELVLKITKMLAPYR
ncbi:MAG: response regulator [Bacteroidales bacterium]|nr:response regulator [Bacteroidales bacterium]